MKFEHVRGEVVQAEGVTTSNTYSDSQGYVSTSSSRHFEVRLKNGNGVRDYTIDTKTAAGDEVVILWANGLQVASANLTSGAYLWRGPPSSYTRRFILIAIAVLGIFLTFGLATVGVLIYWWLDKLKRAKTVRDEIKRLANFT